jgi:hypothetical protein
MVCNGFLYAMHTRGTVCGRDTETTIGQYLKLDNYRYFIRDNTGIPIE